MSFGDALNPKRNGRPRKGDPPRPPKKPRGRPRREVDPVNLPKIARMAGLGLSLEKIARVLGMTPETFAARRAENPAIDAAVEKGRADAEHKVGRSLFDKAAAGDLGSIVWWEKTRAGKVDVSQHRHADAYGNPLPPPGTAILKVYLLPDNGRAPAPPLPPMPPTPARLAAGDVEVHTNGDSPP